MAGSISNYSVKVSGSSAGVDQAFNNAGKSADKLDSKLKGIGGSFKSVGIGVAGVAAAVGIGVGIMTAHQMESIDSTAKLSDSLGISTEALTRLQYAASYSGVATEDLSGSLGKMLRNLNDAQSGSGPAADAFKALGLDAKELVNAKPEEAFSAIADALGNVENPGQRAAAVIDIFGKQGLKLLPLLAEGSDGLAEFGVEADKFGYSFSRIDAAQVEIANDAIQKVKNSFEGVINQLAIKLAPFIAKAADAITDWAQQGDGAAAKVVAGFEWVVNGVAFLLDQFDLVKAAWYIFKGVAISALTPVVDTLALAAQAMDYVLEKLGKKGGTGFGEQLKAAANDLHTQVGEAFTQAGESIKDWESGKNQGKAGKFFDDLRKSSKDAAQQAVEDKPKWTGMWDGIDEGAEKASEKVKAKLEELKNKVNEFNMSKGDQVAADIKRTGGTDAQAEEGKALQDKLDKMEEEKKLQENNSQAAKKYYEDTRTDVEKYQAELKRVNELQEKGLLDSDTAGRAKQKAFDDLFNGKDEKNKAIKVETPNALEFGSAQAANFVAEIQNRQKNPDDLMLKEQRQANKSLKDIAFNTKGGSQQFDLMPF